MPTKFRNKFRVFEDRNITIAVKNHDYGMIKGLVLTNLFCSLHIRNTIKFEGTLSTVMKTKRQYSIEEK